VSFLYSSESRYTDAVRFHVYSMDPESCLQPKEIMPSKGKLKHFMEWFYDTSVGILNTNITVRSMKNSWRVFRAMYRRKTGNKIPDEIGNEVLAVRFWCICSFTPTDLFSSLRQI
jgi:hypothetical protein